MLASLEDCLISSVFWSIGFVYPTRTHPNAIFWPKLSKPKSTRMADRILTMGRVPYRLHGGTIWFMRA